LQYLKKQKNNEIINKLVFTLKNDFGSDIVLIANNHKDLEDHLKENYDHQEAVK